MRSTVHNQEAISFHDRVAEVWEGYYQSDRFQARLEVLASLVPGSLAEQRWLDAGCGTGTLSRWLAYERGAFVLGIDGSAEMLARAAPMAAIEYRQGDILSTGLSNQSFDGIVCSSVLEFLPSPESALGEFHRLLKPGGTLLVSVPNRAPSIRVPLVLIYWLTRPLGKWRRYAYLDHSRHSYLRTEFEAMLRSQGFAPERILEYGGLGLPLGIRFSRVGSLLMASARKA